MTWIIVKTQYEAQHFYQDAPGEVFFLRSPHRHIFHVETQIEVSSHNRELEFFMIKKKLDEFNAKHFAGQVLALSCENMASMIKTFIQEIYPNRAIKVSVFEDNENGALVE